jgi:sarcosine oxidase
MTTRHCRNVVLGAGAMGCATAYHLARRSEPVLLVEQFALPHTRGSSHGAARITRHSYADPRYARLMLDAFDAWRQLEADAGQCVYVRTGGVSLSPAGCDYVAQVAASLEAIGVAHRRMSGRELNRANPVFAVPDDHDVVFEPDAGMLTADRALAIELDLAQSWGGDDLMILAETPVRRIDLRSDRPTLVCDTVRITAERLIVTAGAWVGRLVPALGEALRPTRQQVVYFRPIDESAFAIGRFPIFIYKGFGDWDAFYGMPGILETGVKVARHGGPGVDPDGVEPIVGEEYREVVRAFLRGHLPALAEAPIDRTEVCLYTMAPDEEFVVGPLPARPDILIASPCSGHGFKFSILVGRVLAELAMTGGASIDISAWRRPETVISA